MDYKEFMSEDNKAIIRGRLLQAINKTEMSLYAIAKEMGVSRMSLEWFLEGKKTHNKTLRRIHRWVEEVLMEPLI